MPTVAAIRLLDSTPPWVAVAVVGIIIITFRNKDRSIPLPFGPYLVIAGLVTLLWGHEINATYLGLALG